MQRVVQGKRGVRDRTAAPRASVPAKPKRVRPRKTSEIVADRIRAQIVRGELKEGDSLPQEGQLLEALGVSRPTLREAYRILETENLISVVRGSRSGANVHRPRVDVAARYAGYVLESQHTSVDDLYEARLAIEPFAVRALCGRGAKKRLDRLSEHVAVLTAHLESERVQEFVGGVTEFHALLVELSGNKTLTFMNSLLLNLISRHQLAYRTRHVASAMTDSKRLWAGLKSYKKLLWLMERGQEEAAVEHWRLHLKNAHAIWTSDQEGARTVDSIG